MMIAKLTRLAVSALVVAGCTDQSRGADDRAPSQSIASDSSGELHHWLRTYRGDGFTFVYPADARIVSDTSQAPPVRSIAVNGPDFSASGKSSGRPDSVTQEGPAYSLRVTSHPNTNGRTLSVVADSVMHALNDGLTPDDIASPADSSMATIAGQRVLIVHESCGDCVPTAVYFVSATRIVVFSWNSDAMDLLGPVTRAYYWYMVSSFRWTP